MAALELHDGRAVLARTGALAAEAAALLAAAGPGVPEVVRWDGATLVTTVAPPLPARLIPFDEVAEVLARAHALGVVHGPLEVGHLRGRPGDVVVDGWGSAPAGWAPADDVAELGRLLAELAPAFAAVAARATAPGRPTMAAMVELLRPRTIAPRRALPGWRFPWRPLAVALPAAALVLGIGVAATRSEEAALPPSRPPATTTTDPPVRAVLEHDGRRWAVGEPGDVVVVGDWDCDGLETPAVLRPATGAVWRWIEWSGVPVPVGDAPGAVGLDRTTAGGCDRLRAIDGQGRATAIG